MLTNQQIDALRSFADAARAGGHIYPEMAACEAALESRWGMSELALRCNNLFGQKQSEHPIYGTLVLPTREFLGGKWVAQSARWVKFPALADCFEARMVLLVRLAGDYPHYAAALAANTPEDYVAAVSQSWSTDPSRAAHCLEMYHAHSECFA